jgi:signal recognition particle GTPase
MNGAKMVDFVKDAAGIAMEAINYARDSKIDVVLVDTAGRMQVRGYLNPRISIIVLFLILRLS